MDFFVIIVLISLMILNIYFFFLFQLRETDAELGRGSRLLSGMIFRSLQQRIILAVVALMLIIVACFVMYYSFKSKS